MAWLNSLGNVLVVHHSLRNFKSSGMSGSGRFFRSSDCVRSQAWALAFFNLDNAARSSSSVMGSVLISTQWSFLPEAMNSLNVVETRPVSGAVISVGSG